MQVYSGYYAVDLSYKNYVYLSTTGRVDNLSTLPSNSNTFFYPSVSLATSVGDYIHLPASVDLLKFRVSFADVKGRPDQGPARFGVLCTDRQHVEWRPPGLWF
jgi:hypothetical protein